MKGHLGAVLTSGLSAVALLLALIQAAVVHAHAGRAGAQLSTEAGPAAPSHRFSAPGGRSGIPWQWNADPPARTPGTQQKRDEPRHSPPRSRGAVPEPGPRPARKIAA